MLSLIHRFPLITFALCCLIPVHGILWTALLLGAPTEALKPLKLPFALLPSVSAFLISWLLGGSNEVQLLAGRLISRETKFRAYPVSLLIFPLIGFFALGLIWVLYGTSPNWSGVPPFWQIVILSPFLLLFPGFAEEFGWRGFMQEKLKGKMPVFVGSILIGLLWGTWHGMDFLMGNWSSQAWVIALFIVYIVGVSIIIGRLYVRSHGNVFIAMLAHFGANSVNLFTPVWQTENGLNTPMTYVAVIWVFAIVLIIKDLVFKSETI